jgi:uncharacterized protein YchJ
VLAEVGRGDERVYQTLGEFFQDSDWESTRGAAAVALGILQDPRAVPLLRQALQNESLDEYDVSQVISALNLLGVDITQDREARQAMSRVAMAKRQTGGLRIVEDEEGEAHKLRYDAQGRPMCPDCGGPMEYEDGEWVHAPPEVVRVQPTARPNDPCPCGSGKKYKHCCMRKDLGRYETDRG